jgi:lipopolysaccharide export system permease protein
LRKLNKYLLTDYLVILGVALLLITFAMSVGALYKVIDLMSRGLSASLVGRFFVYNIPYSLAYSIPIACLFSTLLLFGRLSADSEIGAMKSSGLSMWQIVSPVIIISIVLSFVGLYNNFFIYPKTTYVNRQLLKGLGVDDPIKLLEEGKFIRDFPGYMIYVGRKSRHKVYDLVVYEVDKTTGQITTSIRASDGEMAVDEERAELRINLKNVRVEVRNPGEPDDSSKTHYVNAENYPIRLDFNELLGEENVSKKRKNMDLFELVYKVRNLDSEFDYLPRKDRLIEHSRLLVEINQRVCLAMAAFTFVVVAIPLGIKSHRRESSIGMIMSLLIMFIYYLFIILSDALDKYVVLKPWLIPWIPIVSAQVLGLVLMRRAD